LTALEAAGATTLIAAEAEATTTEIAASLFSLARTKAALEALREYLTEQLMEDLAEHTTSAIAQAAKPAVRTALAGVYRQYSRSQGFDPPIGMFLVSPAASDQFVNLGAGQAGTVATAIIADPLFTVPVGTGQLSTGFIIGLKNLRSVVDTFSLSVRP